MKTTDTPAPSRPRRSGPSESTPTAGPTLITGDAPRRTDGRGARSDELAGAGGVRPPAAAGAGARTPRPRPPRPSLHRSGGRSAGAGRHDGRDPGRARGGGAAGSTCPAASRRPTSRAAGRSHAHGFFADLYAAGTRGDGDAGRRAAQFQSAIARLHRRGEQRLDERRRHHPAGDGAAHGTSRRSPGCGRASARSPRPTITDNRPFPVPAFKDTTPSALVGDHVEGAADTAGVVNFAQVTVTPKAKSGRAEVSRELLDSSPALADRVVSGALRESYSQITESTMAGVLAAGATAGPAGGATAVAAEQAIRAALGLLPGTRFAPGRVILPSAHVWAALVGADAPDGRPADPVPAQRADQCGRDVVDARTRRARSPASRLARRGRSPRPTSSSAPARPMP